MGFEPMTSASRCSVLSSELSSQLWGGGGGGSFCEYMYSTGLLRIIYILQNERKSKHETVAWHTKKWYLTPRSHMVHFASRTTRCVISFALIMLT